MKFSFITILLLFGYVTLSAQSTNADNSIIEEYMSLFQAENNAEASLDNLINSREIPYLPNKEMKSSVILKQKGIENYSHVEAEAENLTITQEGEGNFNEFITFYGEGNLTMSIFQEGVDNSISIYGENSLIENMIIVQKANYQDIIITNK